MAWRHLHSSGRQTTERQQAGLQSCCSLGPSSPSGAGNSPWTRPDWAPSAQPQPRHCQPRHSSRLLSRGGNHPPSSTPQRAEGKEAAGYQYAAWQHPTS